MHLRNKVTFSENVVFRKFISERTPPWGNSEMNFRKYVWTEENEKQQQFALFNRVKITTIILHKIKVTYC